ncbi:MAG: hypothetical protein V1753_12495 [Pseudomonadota bacterium]
MAKKRLNVLFLGQRWIEDRLLDYEKGIMATQCLKERPVVFPRSLYLSALLHIYLGKLTLSDIAKAADISIKELRSFKNQVDFLILVDAAKADFAAFFSKKLLNEEYTLAQYRSIAAEFSFLESKIKSRIAVPLLEKMKHLANSILNYHKVRLKLEKADLRSFQRLYSFFLFEKKMLVMSCPEPASNRLDSIARNIVWSNLGEMYPEAEQITQGDVLFNDVDDVKSVIIDGFKPLMQAET